jgi:predicted GTPase
MPKKSPKLKKNTRKIKYSFGQNEYLSNEELQTISEKDASLLVQDITQDFEELLDRVSNDPVYVILTSFDPNKLTDSQQDYLYMVQDMEDALDAILDCQEGYGSNSSRYLLRKLQEQFQDTYLPLRDVLYRSTGLLKM